MFSDFLRQNPPYFFLKKTMEWIIYVTLTTKKVALAQIYNRIVFTKKKRSGCLETGWWIDNNNE